MDELQLLLIERACERLMTDYTRFVDFGEAQRIADLFTTDGVWEGDDITMTGQAAIREGFARRAAITRRVSRHVCTNIRIDVVDSHNANALSYLVNYRHDRRHGEEHGPVPAGLPKYVGDYHDRFTLTAHGWRFTHRRFDLAYLRPTQHP